LIVLGDVSGKGLRAAMTVSLIVGATRMAAETTFSPAEILSALNRRLDGRLNGGFATAIALRLDPDGHCVFSSAGHPAPFLNGEEIQLPGALPLGISANSAYEERSLNFGEFDRLSIYTDGLLEARSASGELYGFGRLQSLFATNPTAAEATQAAVDFGQNDDITVLTLARLAVDQKSTTERTASILAPA
jgi:serine phosphatase RsbU (regulator of sigma subunit)